MCAHEAERRVCVCVCVYERVCERQIKEKRMCLCGTVREIVFLCV